MGIIFVALPLLAVPAWANTWTGTMSWTLTSLNAPDPSGQIGDTFTGSYSYESPTEDYNSDLDPNRNDDVSGSFSIPDWMAPWANGQLPFEMVTFSLQVQGGTVTLYTGSDFGPLSMNMWQDRMNFGISDYFDDPGVNGDTLGGTGTVHFNAPVDPPSGKPASVPDAGSTALMLGLALACLAICRKQPRRRTYSRGRRS